MEPIKRARKAAKLVRKKSRAGERERFPVTLYLNLKRLEAFRKACEKENKSASEVIDEMIQAYLNG